MTDSAKSINDFPVEASIPDSTVSLESILCTNELRRRQSRPPDYKKENHALVALLSALLDSPAKILQTLAETILDVTQCDSSGVSLLTKDGKRFYWPAIAGMWKPHIGGGTPRDFGPCGDVLDHNCTLLFKHFERRYPYFLPVTPLIEECLLVPFYVGGKAVGTIWAITHSDRRKFDAEDERVMSTLGQFASLAYQTVASIEDLKSQVAGRAKRRKQRSVNWPVGWKPRSGGWSTPTLSGSASGTSKVRLSRPMKRFSTWWDTAVKISSRVVCAGRT